MVIIMERFNKLDLSLKFFLLGKGYHRALAAYGIAKNYHTGFRKDGITPEFQHQLEITLHITTLRDIIAEEDTLTSSLLHDTPEDYDMSYQAVLERFGFVVAESVWALTKKNKSMVKVTNEYYAEIAEDYIASIVKGCDRVHNLQSMSGVFSIEKQVSYIQETELHVLPMLKKAATLFPSQSLAYMNIRTTLKSQIKLLQAAIAASKQ
jgi:(p)ppGpp synthase/HD superfamily hydrolase